MTITTIGAGIGASLALVEEASYGLVKPTPAWTFYEPTTAVPKKVKTTKQSSGLAAGRYVDVSSRRVVVERSATVATTMDVCTAGGFTKWINQISSSYATGAAGSQAAANGIWAAGARLQPTAPMYGYSHTFRNSIAGRSASLQLGIPTTDGVLRQYDAMGCKPTKMQFSCKAGDILTLATDWDSRVLEDPLITTAYEGYPNGATQTPYTQAAPSYVVQTPFHFGQAQIQLGTSIALASAASPADGLTGFDLAIERKLNIGRQYYGNAGLKDEPITNDVVSITGNLTSDFVNKTYYADAFYSDTPLFAIVTFAAGALAATTPAIQFVLSEIYLNDGSPGAPNKEIVNNSFPFQALYDLSNEPLSILMQTADATG
jgi:hypothetical protein